MYVCMYICLYLSFYLWYVLKAWSQLVVLFWKLLEVWKVAPGWRSLGHTCGYVSCPCHFLTFPFVSWLAEGEQFFLGHTPHLWCVSKGPETWNKPNMDLSFWKHEVMHFSFLNTLSQIFFTARKMCVLIYQCSSDTCKGP